MRFLSSFNGFQLYQFSDFSPPLSRSSDIQPNQNNHISVRNDLKPNITLFKGLAVMMTNCDMI